MTAQWYGRPLTAPHSAFRNRWITVASRRGISVTRALIDPQRLTHQDEQFDFECRAQFREQTEGPEGAAVVGRPRAIPREKRHFGSPWFSMNRGGLLGPNGSRCTYSRFLRRIRGPRFT